jgi:hypothetical protein
MIHKLSNVDDWHLQRWGKFTASENNKLFAAGTGTNLFGVGAVSYIKAKAIQMCTDMHERPELEEVASLLHGKAHEFPAFQMYIQRTRNFRMAYLGDETPVFLDHEDLMYEAGGTPDAGIIDFKKGKVELGLEIKCPKNSQYHFDRLLWKDQWDVKEKYPLVYTQIQHLLMITKAPEWHFASFDDRFKQDSKKIKIIEVKPDIAYQGKLMIRLEKAISEKYRLIALHYNNDNIVDRESFLKFAA